MAAKRISPREAHQRVAGGDAQLVCAYDDDDQFQENHLEGATSLSEFRAQEGNLDKQTEEVIFYCA